VYGAAIAVIAIATTASAVIGIASTYHSIATLVLTMSLVRIVRHQTGFENAPRLGCMRLTTGITGRSIRLPDSG